MRPNLNVCHKCSYYRSDVHNVEDKKRCFLDGPYYLSCENDSIARILGKRTRSRENPPTLIPDDCPYALEHMISEEASNDGEHTDLQAMRSVPSQ